MRFLRAPKAILVSQNHLGGNVRFKVSNLNGLTSHVKAKADLLLSPTFQILPAKSSIPESGHQRTKYERWSMPIPARCSARRA